MNDPQITKFLNDHVRPRAELIRALNALIEDDLNTWGSVIAPLLQKSGSEIIDDGRDAEGVSRLTGDDVTAFIALLTDMQGILLKLGSQDAMRKPCVRPLEIKVTL